MSHADDTTTRLLGELASLELPRDAPRREAQRRTATVGRMRAAIVEDRRGKGHRWLVGWVAAASVLTVLLVIWRAWPDHTDSVPVAETAAGRLLAHGNGTELIREGHTQTLHASETARLQPADVLQTSADSSVSVATTMGVAVDVQGATRVRFEPTTARPGHERLGLMFGRIDVDVPEDGSPREFTVQTPQATVVVHGTRFAVEVARERPSDRVSTRVHVTRGRVGVRTASGERMLGAGSTWSSQPEETPPKLSPVHSAPAPSAAPRAEPATDRRPATASSSLAEQNAIYAGAMQAKQRGDDQRVVAELDRLLRRFPQSPLIPDARVERFRALQRLGRTEEAARSARQYLADQPDGFARDEARDVALGHSSAPGEKP